MGKVLCFGLIILAINIWDAAIQQWGGQEGGRRGWA
jgi:hypothetical protein